MGRVREGGKKDVVAARREVGRVVSIPAEVEMTGRRTVVSLTN